jgi:hypothetical protein
MPRSKNRVLEIENDGEYMAFNSFAGTARW